jgi:hypothetical protein
MTRRSFAAFLAVTLLAAAPAADAQAPCAAQAPVAGVRDSAEVSIFMTGYPSPDAGVRVSRVSFPNYADIAARPKTLALAAFQRDEIRVRAGRQERVVDVHYVSASYFDVLGVTMQVGSAFAPEADDPRLAPKAVVLSDALWTSMFGRDPAIVGRTLNVNGTTVNVAGVAAAGFGGLHGAAETLWLPGVAYPVLSGYPGMRAADRGAGGYYTFVVRPARGATAAAVQEELAGLTGWLADAFPGVNGKFTVAGFHDYGPIGCLPGR